MRKVFLFLLFISLIKQGFSTEKILFSKLDINAGLSQNHINCIFKDSKGFVWIGTMSGLNRYDGSLFKIFRNDANDSASIIDNFIISITEDNFGCLWILTRLGYNIYNPVDESFSRQAPECFSAIGSDFTQINEMTKDIDGGLWFAQSNLGVIYYNPLENKCELLKVNPKNTECLSSKAVRAITNDTEGNLLTINDNAVIERIDHKTKKVTQRITSIRNICGDLAFYKIMCDKENLIWVYSTNVASGIYQINPRTLKTRIFNTKSLPALNNNIIRAVEDDGLGRIWIGTDHGGINIIDKKADKITVLTSDNNNEYSLSQNAITCIYKDNTNIVWVGTYKRGVNFYHPNLVKFDLYRHESSKANSIGFDDINCFAEDKKENLWIGTNNGGIFYFDRKTNTFKNYKHNPSDPASLPNNVILKLYIDKDDKLWVASYYGGLSYFDGQKFVRFKHDDKNPQSLSDDKVWDIFEDSQGNFWIGTLGSGLDLFDRKKNIFYHYKYGEVNSVSSNYILHIAEDKNRNLWLATALGVNMLEHKTGRFVYFNNIPSDKNSLCNNNVTFVFPDSRGLIWIGTREGLSIYNPFTRKINSYFMNDGLPSNTIQSITEDNLHHIWISTTNGLTRFFIKSFTNNKLEFDIFNYDKSDGLQGSEFNEKACLKTSKGELVFGGANGFNIFKPQQIKSNTTPPPVYITDLYLFNEKVKVNKPVFKRIVLTKSLMNNKKLKLRYSENIFSIEFAALNYLHPEKNRFKYKLEGFNETWIETNSLHPKATYTNLDPGRYIFRVIASNDDGVWNKEGASLEIVVSPPFWRSVIAFVLYFLIIFGILIYARHQVVKKARIKFSLENERKEAKRLHELDMLKIRFFTNISHEFRTPLTLIITPLEKLLKTTQDTILLGQLNLIHRNAKRLLNLVNQLLDIRRLEVEPFKLNLQLGDLIYFVRDITTSFSDFGEKKNIQLIFKSNVEYINIAFDADKMEKILFNLLSNAFKFTYENGKIEVNIEYNKLGDNSKDAVTIKVKDTGIGIPHELQESIFEPFIQNTEMPANIINQGSGIGLALTKEFVRLHNGRIWVESEPGKGSCFYVELPVNVSAEAVGGNNIETVLINAEKEALPENETDEPSNKTKSSLMLVEDNEDLRFYLKDNLRIHYQIFESGNGTDALKQIMEVVPDLVVSDIAIPGIDGIELCKRLKNDKRTSHIPVILLTAHLDNTQKVNGFEAGADDYLTKPFSFEILESRIKNLISLRDSLRKTFKTNFDLNPSEVEIVSLDEKFLKKTLEVVEKQIGNPDFSVEDLSKEMGMSRVHLYKKLLFLTGKTPSEFIRLIRLKRAAQLLQKSQLTVAEISYQTGFNNPKYFARYFRDEFGILPSAYAHEYKNKQE
ncbi:MAG TPA: two-component regulator propeller domain-containing protein [Bacteroidales bacterium]|nr:two-component regulator propeller domain-containing protein [Bacteroidales bacterium]